MGVGVVDTAGCRAPKTALTLTLALGKESRRRIAMSRPPVCWTNLRRRLTIAGVFVVVRSEEVRRGTWRVRGVCVEVGWGVLR